MQPVASNRHRSGKRRSVPQQLAGLVAALAIAVSGCAAVSPSSLDSPAGLVAPSGEILLPPCPASAGCIEGFVVGHTLYGISCHGVETTAVGAATMARGAGAFREARAIDGVPPDLWLAVRGDLPCLPGEDESLAYEWYLAQGQTTEADIEEWGERVADLTLPIDPGSTDSSD